MNNFWNILIPIFSTIAGSGITYIFTRRKNTAEARGSELDNVEAALKIYRGMIEDLSIKVNLQSEIIANQQIEIQQLRNEIAQLKMNKRC